MKIQTPSKKYWQERALNTESLMQKKGRRAILKVTNAYNRSVESINGMLKRIFTRYAIDGKITSQQARELLNSVESREFIEDLKVKISQIEDNEVKREMLNYINAPAYAARLTRLEALKEQVYIQMRKTAGEEITIERNTYMDVYKESYYRTIFDIQQGLGVGVNFALVPDKAAISVLNHNWKGRNFAKSVWNNTGILAKRASSVIESGILSGASIERMSKEIADLSCKGKSAAVRLIRTETNYFMNQGEIAGYKEVGIDKYEYLATLDFRTSSMCASLDGSVFSVNNAQVGVNYPPMHPYCRSTTIAWFDDKTTGTRIARSEDGSTYKVPSDMKYDEWKGKYVDKINKNGIIKNKTKMAVKDVNTVGKIDVEKYKCVSKDIRTNEVIITNRQVEHIRSRHPNDYEKYSKYFETIISKPDYIIEANKPNTALILKNIKLENEYFKTVLRMATSTDRTDIKNSIITFMKIDEKEWNRLLRNKKILYKSE